MFAQQQRESCQTKKKFELADSIVCIQEKEKNDNLLKSASADNEMIAHLPKACD